MKDPADKTAQTRGEAGKTAGFVQVRGASQNNLKGLNADIPRDSFVVFTGISGSGKSSLVFGTIFAEAQKRYFESVAPYARRLIEQLPAAKVGEIRGLPPAVALQQRRAETNSRSTAGTLTGISNLLRLLYSRAGDYPNETDERLDSDCFSPNTQSGACPSCQGLGVKHSVSERSLVPDPSLSIREKAIAAWPGAWQGKNFRDILATLGYDIDKPWKDLPEKDRKWILFTEERPVVTVYAEREAHRIQRPYQGTYMSAAAYVTHTFATTSSATLRKRAAQYMESSRCSDCGGKKLNRQALSVRFADMDIAEAGSISLSELALLLASRQKAGGMSSKRHSEKSAATSLIVSDILDRVKVLSDLGLDYLSLDRPSGTLSFGELQRLRLVTQLRSGLFGVVYILDEPSAGLHPSDSESLLKILKELQASGNSLFVVEHDMKIARQADWIVDIGPGAGDGGGKLLYSGPVSGLKSVKESVTAKYLFPDKEKARRQPREAQEWLKLSAVSRNNLKEIEVEFPIALFTVVSGVSGAGKSTLVGQVLAEAVAQKLGLNWQKEESPDNCEELCRETNGPAKIQGLKSINRLVRVDQKPIGRTPRSNLATYTGLFDTIRQIFASTKKSRALGYNAGRFSFNVSGGRCEHCEGEGFISVELIFLPTVYSPCSSCRGSRYNSETLQIEYRSHNIAQILDMNVDDAFEFFADLPAAARTLKALRDVGLGYLKLGQPATELSGGEAQRIKLASELQRKQAGKTLYLLDEPGTGLHPDDLEKLILQLQTLVDSGNTVIVVENDMDVVAAADWVIDMGPGAGVNGGRIVAFGPPESVAACGESKTAAFLKAKLKEKFS